MATLRELARGGALMRAVILLRFQWSDSKVLDRLLQVFPEGTPAQHTQLIALAKQGIAFADSVDWTDKDFVIDMSLAPPMP